jgi:MFS family permease
MSSVFRHRDFTLLWSGLTVSDLGNAVTFVALPLVAVLALHATAFEVGLISAASSFAWLVVALPAGVWVDRTRRRPVMIASDAARALLMASIPVAWWLGVLTVAQLVVVALLVGVGTVLFTIADTAFMPLVLPRDRFADGNGAIQASMSAANIAGPGLAGVLVQVVGAPVTLLVDAVSFLVSAGTVSAMRTREPAPPRPAQRPHLLAEVRDGLRYVFANPLPRTLALGIGLCNLVLGGYDTVVILFLVRQLHLSAGLVGVLFGVGSVGGLLGSLLAGRTARRFGDARTPVIMTVVMAAGGLLLPFTTAGAGLTWFVIGSVVLSAAIGVFNVCVISAMQATTPARMLGRANASTRVFTRGAIPLGALAGGALATWLAPRWALTVMMAMQLPMAVVFRLSPLGRVRTVAELVPAEPDSEPQPAPELRPRHEPEPQSEPAAP